MSSPSGALSIVGWWVLPSLATSWIQSLYYSITYRAGTPHPARGTSIHTQHRRAIQTLVIFIYLLYTIVEAYHETVTTGSYYSVLSLAPWATDKEIKSRFRRLAAIHHPDKMGEAGGNSELFIAMKVAAETLGHPVKRFAYDRLGPSVHSMGNLAAPVEFIMESIVSSLVPHYLMTALLLGILQFLSLLDTSVARWLLLCGTFLVEATLLSRPKLPSLYISFLAPVLSYLPNSQPLVQFQIIGLIRRLSVTIAIALTQLIPLISLPTPSSNPTALKESLSRLDGLANLLEKEVGALMGVEIGPFKDDKGRINELRNAVNEWLVENTIRSDPMVRDAMGRELRRRRGDAPHGAKGRRTDRMRERVIRPS